MQPRARGPNSFAQSKSASLQAVVLVATHEERAEHPLQDLWTAAKLGAWRSGFGWMRCCFVAMPAQCQMAHETSATSASVTYGSHQMPGGLCAPQRFLQRAFPANPAQASASAAREKARIRLHFELGSPGSKPSGMRWQARPAVMRLLEVSAEMRTVTLQNDTTSGL